MPAGILGVGSYVPDNIVSNDDLAKILDTSDDWIFSHTGIRNRHICKEGETSSVLAIEAAKAAIKSANISSNDIDLLIVCTTTPDYLGFPAEACLVQAALNISDCMAFDLSAACSGFVYGLRIAAAMVEASTVKNVLLIGAEVLSSIVDWQDRGTAVLFGDGAGAAVICSSSEQGIIDSIAYSDGSGAESLIIANGGTKNPGLASKLSMNGRSVYNFAVQKMREVILELLEKNNLGIEDLRYIVPHQANVRIVQATAKRLQFPLEKFYMNMENFANTSSASIPIALDEMRHLGLLEKGDLIITVGFGAGLTYGGNLLRW